MSAVTGTHQIATEQAMMSFAEQLHKQLVAPAVITLAGELGTGKSVLARGIIRTCGHDGAVKSPTYTLVETYNTEHWRIAHLDLYRLVDPEELIYIGFEDIVANSDLLLVEWPDKAGNLLPRPTLEVTINYHGAGREVHIVSPDIAS